MSVCCVVQRSLEIVMPHEWKFDKLCMTGQCWHVSVCSVVQRSLEIVMPHEWKLDKLCITSQC